MTVAGEIGQAFPERPQPAARFVGSAQQNRTLCRMGGNKGVASIHGIQLQPDAPELVQVVRGVQRLEGQRAQQALGRGL